jgi:hypothetical protein
MGTKNRMIMFGEMERNGKEKFAIHHPLSHQGLMVGLVLPPPPPYPN